MRKYLPLLAALTLGAPHHAAAQTEAARFVELDGLRIRVLTIGLENRDPRQAVVVFENGGSAALETWDRVLPEVSRFAPVVAYDRSGSGQSEWDGMPPTPDRAVARLRKLLAELDVAPPYLLVGHSWGGALVRYFAGHHAEELSAVVYLDPTEITLRPAEELAVFESIGADAAARDAFYTMQERAMAGAPPELREESAVILRLMRSDVDERALGTTPDVPATVILAGKVPAFPPNALPFDATAYSAAMHRSRLERMRDWTREPGRYVVLATSGHIVQADDPARVIGEIRHLAVARP